MGRKLNRQKFHSQVWRETRQGSFSKENDLRLGTGEKNGHSYGAQEGPVIFEGAIEKLGRRERLGHEL